MKIEKLRKAVATANAKAVESLAQAQKFIDAAAATYQTHRTAKQAFKQAKAQARTAKDAWHAARKLAQANTTQAAKDGKSAARLEKKLAKSTIPAVKEKAESARTRVGKKK